MSGERVVVNKYEAAVILKARTIVPALTISRAGPRVEEMTFEFLAARIRYVNTRMTCLRAVQKLFAWTEARTLGLGQARPLHVTAYVG